MKSKPLISLVVPCRNEAACLKEFIAQLNRFKSSYLTVDLEVVFVNDGSTDRTLDLLGEASERNEWIKIVDFSRNFGKEAAITAGLDFAAGDAIIFMDADLQHPFSVLPVFIEHWQSGVQVVVARRMNRDTDSSSYRRLATLFYKMYNRIATVKLPENVGDFRLIDKAVAKELRRLTERQRFMKGLFAWVGFEPTVVDYEVAPRHAGQSTFNKWRSWNFALEGLANFSTVPLRAWTYLGLLFVLIGLIYAGFIIVSALLFGVTTPGYVTLLTAIVVFSGMQLIGIGVLGEYLGRVFIEVKGRPAYIVRKTLNLENPRLSDD
ncbi:glycosyltransferase family 2 protein [Limnobacter parvus]|uniref:Glycosyltransferase family 2 protein n=1 Tax=Limnobacter parvus TaxID=2939690 RepID=A0ABT1XF57_9BURK|nr:glycosyltransferase family 2 protein [Limnobacter parvus]MCR2745233.1 glycosyltransferase family 2 protein [Limnobacter parvus]